MNVGVDNCDLTYRNGTLPSSLRARQNIDKCEDICCNIQTAMRAVSYCGIKDSSCLLVNDPAS